MPLNYNFSCALLTVSRDMKLNPQQAPLYVSITIHIHTVSPVYTGLFSQCPYTQQSTHTGIFTSSFRTVWVWWCVFVAPVKARRLPPLSLLLVCIGWWPHVIPGIAPPDSNPRAGLIKWNNLKQLCGCAGPVSGEYIIRLHASQLAIMFAGWQTCRTVCTLLTVPQYVF